MELAIGLEPAVEATPSRGPGAHLTGVRSRQRERTIHRRKARRAWMAAQRELAVEEKRRNEAAAGVSTYAAADPVSPEDHARELLWAVKNEETGLCPSPPRPLIGSGLHGRPPHAQVLRGKILNVSDVVLHVLRMRGSGEAPAATEECWRAPVDPTAVRVTPADNVLCTYTFPA